MNELLWVRVRRVNHRNGHRLLQCADRFYCLGMAWTCHPHDSSPSPPLPPSLTLHHHQYILTRFCCLKIIFNFVNLITGQRVFVHIRTMTPAPALKGRILCLLSRFFFRRWQNSPPQKIWFSLNIAESLNLAAKIFPKIVNWQVHRPNSHHWIVTVVAFWFYHSGVSVCKNNETLSYIFAWKVQFELNWSKLNT